MSLRIRPYERADRDAVRRICFDTGYLGDSIAPTFGDEACWGDMMSAYYTDREPESCFVAESEGKVLGYLLGTLDARHIPATELVALRHGVLRMLPLRPRTAGFYFRALRDTVRDRLDSVIRMHPDLALYPGHAHFSVRKEARSMPIAPALFRAFFKHAKAQSCPGLHGEVFVENERALQLNKALGYEIAGSPWPAPGIRAPDGKRLHVQLLVRKL